eukprot:TCONS_00009890-protein
MIAQHCHSLVHHAGRGITINEIRSRGYWITNINSVVRTLIAKCVQCRKLRGTATPQKMSDLPSERFDESPPFTVCGVDYFGPFIIKEKRKELKRYGSLFTCFASRAVHIELSHSLETDSFIQSLRRFIARRGNIRTMHSDNGTNFVGAANELRNAVLELDDDKINRFLNLQGGDWIRWKRNPPLASHFGGVWERQIRSVRSILNSLLSTHGHSLDDESFRTFMCEAEAVINSRPLTTETLSDPSSPLPLSPSNLLTMKSNVVAPPPGEFKSAGVFTRKRWRRVQHLLNEFWSRWRKEYCQNIQQRSKWLKERRSFKVGDVALLTDASDIRNEWRLCMIDEVITSTDGNVRQVVVRMADGSLFKRPVSKLVLLVEGDSPPMSLI